MQVAAGTGTSKEKYMSAINILPISAVDPLEKLESNSQLQVLRNKGMAAYSNGVLYVARSYAADAGVASLEAYCKRHAISLRKELVDVEEINRLNSTIAHSINDTESHVLQNFTEITRKAVLDGASDIHIIVEAKARSSNSVCMVI